MENEGLPPKWDKNSISSYNFSYNIFNWCHKTYLLIFYWRMGGVYCIWFSETFSNIPQSCGRKCGCKKASRVLHLLICIFIFMGIYTSKSFFRIDFIFRYVLHFICQYGEKISSFKFKLNPLDKFLTLFLQCETTNFFSILIKPYTV